MSNTEIWDKLAKTDPAHTKRFKRSGGFQGTAIKPIYTERKMTEVFGAAGLGWGIGVPSFETVHGHNGEVMVYCTVGLWWADEPQKRNWVYGVGGDKIVSYVKASEQYNRPERWENDDEAFKKAFTDAVGNAMKHLGMSADVHMGLFDDNKYVESVADEIHHGVVPTNVERISAERAKKILNFENMIREIDTSSTAKVLDNWAEFYREADAWLPGGWAARLLERIAERRAQMEQEPIGGVDPNESLDRQYAEIVQN